MEAEAIETPSTTEQAPESTEGESSDNVTAKENPEAFDAKKLGEKTLTPAEKIKIKFKSKIDGVEEETELDEDTIRRDYQKWKAADKRFQEAAMTRKQAAMTRKQAEEAIAKMRDKQGLIEAMRQLGHDPRALAEEFLASELEYQLMSPEKKRIYELEREKFFRDKADKEREAAEKSAKEKEATERITQKLQAEVIETLKTTNLPQTPQMVWRMANQMKIHLQKGIDITASEAAELVQQELIAENKAILGKMPVAKLKEIIGKDLTNAILKDSLTQVKDPVKRTNKPTDSISERLQNKKPDKGYVSQADFEKHMQAIRGRK